MLEVCLMFELMHESLCVFNFLDDRVLLLTPSYYLLFYGQRLFTTNISIMTQWLFLFNFFYGFLLFLSYFSPLFFYIFNCEFFVFHFYSLTLLSLPPPPPLLLSFFLSYFSAPQNLIE